MLGTSAAQVNRNWGGAWGIGAFSPAKTMLIWRLTAHPQKDEPPYDPA